jgi:hypothetical protein
MLMNISVSVTAAKKQLFLNRELYINQFRQNYGQQVQQQRKNII